jgi:hypothetical protein
VGPTCHTLFTRLSCVFFHATAMPARAATRRQPSVPFPICPKPAVPSGISLFASPSALELHIPLSEAVRQAPFFSTVAEPRSPSVPDNVGSTATRRSSARPHTKPPVPAAFSPSPAPSLLRPHLSPGRVTGARSPRTVRRQSHLLGPSRFRHIPGAGRPTHLCAGRTVDDPNATANFQSHSCSYKYVLSAACSTRASARPPPATVVAYDRSTSAQIAPAVRRPSRRRALRAGRRELPTPRSALPRPHRTAPHRRVASAAWASLGLGGPLVGPTIAGRFGHFSRASTAGHQPLRSGPVFNCIAIFVCLAHDNK